VPPALEWSKGTAGGPFLSAGCNGTLFGARCPPMKPSRNTKIHLRKPAAFLLLGWSCAAFLCSPAAAQDAKFAEAISRIQERIEKSGGEVGVAFRTMDGKSEWFLRADESFHAASTMKIPVMIELFHQVREGKVKLDETLTVKNEFHSIVDGSAYALDASDDSDAQLYKAEGKTRTLAELCELMITVSSNLATNLLIERLGVDAIRAGVHDLNADGMKVVRGVEDNKAFEKGLNNTTTARGLLILMEAIAKGKAVDGDASGHMTEILKRQQFKEAIPAGLPPNTPVAHKTGEITKIHHDAAIVYSPRPFVLVVLVWGIVESKDSALLIAEITRLLYSATQ
jgi:beta-lactamase class A